MHTKFGIGCKTNSFANGGKFWAGPSLVAKFCGETLKRHQKPHLKSATTGSPDEEIHYPKKATE